MKTCATCGAALTGRQTKFCTPEHRNLAYKQKLALEKPEHAQLHCTHCNGQLTGRQTMWCSLACKRDHETQLAVVDGIETYVRKCIKCGLMKPLAVDFYKTPTGTYRRQCRACVMAGNDVRNAKPDATDRSRSYHLQSLYGISSQEYEALLAAQDGTCAVCDKPPIKRRLALDHSHRTGAIRGLLCNHCNLRVIGKQTDAAVLQRAVEYLANPPAEKVFGQRIVPKRVPPSRRRKRRKKAA
jgi:hypothetical protein